MLHVACLSFFLFLTSKTRSLPFLAFASATLSAVHFASELKERGCWKKKKQKRKQEKERKHGLLMQVARFAETS